MSNMSSESEEMIMSRDSPTIDEGSSERNMVGNGTLKKGPWTSAEDAILVDYVNKHGEGNWNAVQKHSGLSRCGKSCRLRWANHLRPDLKKGAFTAEEERRIIELHAKMGNKWARMAVELPGRTDNEIKNFWNTRTKRRQRAGLPIYPPDICLQTLNENVQTQNMVTFATNGDNSSHHDDMMPNTNFQIPAVEFKNLELNHEIYPPNILDLPSASYLDITTNSLLPQGLGSSCINNSSNNNFLFPIPKRIRRSDTYDNVGGGMDDYFAYQDGQTFDFPQSQSQSESQRFEFSGSHAYIKNGNNTSSSEPISWATKMELPSLQYSTQMGSCGAPSSPLPSLESADTLVHSAFIGHGQTKSNSPSPRNNGLLEAVLYESQTMKMSNNVPRDITDSSSRDDWYGDPVSPMGHSAASVFSEYTPHISGSSFDELHSIEAISVKREAEESGGNKQYEKEEEKAPNQIDYSRPDFLLGTNWFPSSSNADQRNMVSDPIRALLGDDFCTQSKHNNPFSLPESTKWDDDISDIYKPSGNL